MLALIIAVFTASVLGSLHCAGMCGGFLAFAVGVGGESERRASRATLLAAYNGGRLVTYTFLGAASGLIGRAVDLGGEAVGLQRSAAALAGAMMIGFGLLALAKIRGVRLPANRLATLLQPVVVAGHRAAAALPPTGRAGAVGLLTTLLPCGWLYAFAITAAGTGSPWLGALTMAVFWAGTLPMMVSLGAGLSALTGALGRRLPTVMASLIVVIGLATLLGRVQIPALGGHDAVVQPASFEDAADRVRGLNHEDMPCCGTASGAGETGR